MKRDSLRWWISFFIESEQTKLTTTEYIYMYTINSLYKCGTYVARKRL